MLEVMTLPKRKNINDLHNTTLETESNEREVSFETNELFSLRPLCIFLDQTPRHSHPHEKNGFGHGLVQRATFDAKHLTYSRKTRIASHCQLFESDL